MNIPSKILWKSHPKSPGALMSEVSQLGRLYRATEPLGLLHKSWRKETPRKPNAQCGELRVSKNPEFLLSLKLVSMQFYRGVASEGTISVPPKVVAG